MFSKESRLVMVMSMTMAFWALRRYILLIAFINDIALALNLLYVEFKIWI